jgi:hypothetical protein
MMATVPVLDVLLVALEFVALFATTWIAWFAVITLYQFVHRKTRNRHSYRQAGPKAQ